MGNSDKRTSRLPQTAVVCAATDHDPGPYGGQPATSGMTSAANLCRLGAFGGGLVAESQISSCKPIAANVQMSPAILFSVGRTQAATSRSPTRCR